MILKNWFIAVALILLSCSGHGDGRAGLLQNPNFEGAPANAGWKIVVYGAHPQRNPDG